MLMKMMNISRLKAIIVLCAMATCILGASAFTSEYMPSTQDVTKGDTPFGIFSKVWKNVHKDDTPVTLLTRVPKDKLKLMAQQLKKDFNVKKDVIFDQPYYYVGEVITAYTQQLYGGKADPENAFRAIQYSPFVDVMNSYIEKYPESPHCAEIIARRACFAENDLWEEAHEKKTREAYEAFASACSNTPCKYEGCEAISAANHKNAEAVREWYALVDSSEKKGPSVYKDFANYIKKYGEDSEFAEEARIQYVLYKDRYDWSVALKQNTNKAIQGYLQNHPDGQYVEFARNMLEEVELWDKAKATHSYDDYCAYYDRYPDGEHAAEAIKLLKQYEEETWKATKASKKLDAYENFIKEHPKGYYANEARNIIAKTKMEQNKNVKPSFTEFKRAGDYSHPGYSLIYFGNADNKQRVLTFSMTGPTGYSESIRADDLKWVRVKNGTYEVLIQGTKDEIIRGSVTVENGIYYKVLWTGNNQNKETTDKMLNVIVDKVEEEKMYIEGAK